MAKQVKSLLNSIAYYVLVSLSITLPLYTSDVFAGKVTLAWNASSGPVRGYRVYYGSASRNYTNNLNVGNTTTYTVAGLQDDKTYFFAVKAYDNAGNQSNFSNEVNNSFIKNDFNGDRKADLVWQRRTTGQRALWFMNGAIRTGSANLGIVDVNWDIAGAGDFNGDGKADLVLQHRTTGHRVLWFMNGATRTSSPSLGIFDVNWNIAGPATSTATAKPIWSGSAAPPATGCSGL